MISLLLILPSLLAAANNTTNSTTAASSNTSTSIRAPAFQRSMNDSQLHAPIPRRAGNETKDGWNTFANNTRSNHSFFLYKNDPRHVMIVSVSNTTSAVLRFSTEPHPRWGVEWSHGHGVVNGSSADIAHSARFVGMYESNGGVNGTNNGTKYLFSQMKWSDIYLSPTESAGVNGTGKKLTIYSFGTHPDGMVFNLTLHLSTETENNMSPFGFKYDVDMKGSPTYVYPTSNFTLVKIIHNSGRDIANSSEKQMAMGSSKFSWVNWGLADGRNVSLAFNGVNSGNLVNSSWAEVSTLDRDANLDSYCSKSVVSFTIPRFTSSFWWDPTLSIDDSASTSAYATSSEGASDASSSKPVPSAGFAGAKPAMALIMIVLGLALF